MLLTCRRIAAAVFLLTSFAAQASGPYQVDDAAITPPGEAQLETWVSLARRGQLFVMAPATTLRAAPFLEWSLILETGRFDGEGATGLTLGGKALFGSEAKDAGDIAIGASGAIRLPLDGVGATDFAFNGIATIAASDRLLVHGNLGWSRTQMERVSALTWGVRAEAEAMPERLALHGEVFGTSRSSAGVQLGLRPTILDGRMDLELIFSRNLGDERESWATLGLAVRF